MLTDRVTKYIWRKLVVICQRMAYKDFTHSIINAQFAADALLSFGPITVRRMLTDIVFVGKFLWHICTNKSNSWYMILSLGLMSRGIYVPKYATEIHDFCHVRVFLIYWIVLNHRQDFGTASLWDKCMQPSHPKSVLNFAFQSWFGENYYTKGSEQDEIFHVFQEPWRFNCNQFK